MEAFINNNNNSNNNNKKKIKKIISNNYKIKYNKKHKNKKVYK